MYLIYLLGFKKGSNTSNGFGNPQGLSTDYYKNGNAEPIPHLKTGEHIVNDITGLNPILVSKVIRPTSTQELVDIIKTSETPISIGGGRFSMGGQTASPNSVHIDLRELNKILHFDATTKVIKVEPGVRWCDIQQFIDPHNLSVKIMQSYANFTVGGSLSVNVHGRYIGLGPLILSVKSIEVVLASGEIIFATPLENTNIFNACIGCYNAIGVIISVELELEENVLMERKAVKMKANEYKYFFSQSIRENSDVIFHNGDLYPPFYKNIRAVSWVKSNQQKKNIPRLMPLASSYPIERYMINSFSKNKFGKWRREYLIDPLFYLRKKFRWRNYEAGYDVLELEPESRVTSTYVLQEYFVPINSFDQFTQKMSEVFMRYNVNVINISIRHAKQDSGSLLAWAKEEVFAFVVYYKQFTNEIEKNKVGIWTRELIDIALSLDGSYYLPYQTHATKAQFHKAYPNAQKLFELKKELDPKFTFRNVMWDTYYDYDTTK
jgi:FAD/FMN-containing dehydrogenase